MNIFKKVIVFQLLLASIAFPVYSMRTNLSTFMQGGATEAQYPRFMSEFRSHYPAYIGEINSILSARRPHTTGRIPDYAKPIGSDHSKKLASFLGHLSVIHVPTDEITRMRGVFNARRQRYNRRTISISEITERALDITEETDFHHIIPLELCGEKQTTYYTRTLRGNDPFNVIQLTVTEHRRLTDFINGLR